MQGTYTLYLLGPKAALAQLLDAMDVGCDLTWGDADMLRACDPALLVPETFFDAPPEAVFHIAMVQERPCNLLLASEEAEELHRQLPDVELLYVESRQETPYMGHFLHGPAGVETCRAFDTVRDGPVFPVDWEQGTITVADGELLSFDPGGGEAALWDAFSLWCEAHGADPERWGYASIPEELISCDGNWKLDGPLAALVNLQL